MVNESHSSCSKALYVFITISHVQTLGLSPGWLKLNPGFEGTQMITEIAAQHRLRVFLFFVLLCSKYKH